MHIRFVLLLVALLNLASTETAHAQTSKSGRYAFLVSCGRYDATQLKALPYTNSEMQEFRNVLLESGYQLDDIVFLKDEGKAEHIANRKNVLKQLDLILASASHSQDSILVAFNGHGVQFKGEKSGYFCPIDAELSDRKSLIPTEEIFKRLEKCKAKQKILLVNACRNDPAQFPNQAANQIDLDAKDTDVVPEGIAALYSCTDQQLSYYYPPTGEYQGRKRSLFFHHLIETWKSGFKQDGLTVDQLFSQVRRNTMTEARLIFNQSQTPEIRRKVDGMGEWKLFNSSEVVKKPEMKRPMPKIESEPMVPKPQPVVPKVDEITAENFRFNGSVEVKLSAQPKAPKNQYRAIAAKVDSIEQIASAGGTVTAYKVKFVRTDNGANLGTYEIARTTKWEYWGGRGAHHTMDPTTWRVGQMNAVTFNLSDSKTGKLNPSKIFNMNAFKAD
jgi:hypothetical protein